LRVDLPCPLNCCGLQVGVVHHAVHGTHLVHRLCVDGFAEEEDLAGELLAHLLGQVRGTIAGGEGTHVGVRLLELRVLAGSQGQVADHVQAVPTAGGPAVDQADHDFRHGADQSLHLQDVQATALDLRSSLVHALGTSGGDVRIVAGGVLITGTAADALVTTGAECPPAVLRGRSVAGQQDGADVRGAARVVERAVQLVDGVRAEGVAHLRPVEGDADDAVGAALAGVAVVGDVVEVESLNLAPGGGVEDLGNLVFAHACPY